MQYRRRWSAIADRQLDQDVIGVRFGILNLAIKISFVVKNSCVQQLILVFGSRASPIDIRQALIRKPGLRVFI